MNGIVRCCIRIAGSLGGVLGILGRGIGRSSAPA